MNVIVLGAGLAGLSSAYHLQRRGLDYELYERDKKVGGLCRTETVNGFTFDRTLHVLFMSNEYVKKLVNQMIGKKLLLHKRKALVYYKGAFVPYPFQAYFSLLPFPDVVEDCTTGLLRAKEKGDEHFEVRNLKEWIYHTFGHGIAKHFMIPYNQKLWNTPLDRISSDWTEKYVPRPDINEILRFARMPTKIKETYGYNIKFRYPIKEGIEILSKAFESRLNSRFLHLNHKLETISLKKRKVFLSSGEDIHWDVLVSTIPLPEIISCIKDAPLVIKRAAKNLKCVSIYNLNVGIDEKQKSLAHWIYFPEHTFIFHRIGFPSNLSPYMAPSGTSSLSVEVSYSKYKSISMEKANSRIVKDLMRVGLIDSEDNIIARKPFILPNAYVIYDQRYDVNRQKIHSFLKKEKIFSIGRYGSWKYSTMEDTILEGKNVTEQILNSSLR